MSDGVIHTGFIHDFSKFTANCEIDRNAIEALGSALVGSDHPLVITSGIGLLRQGRLATEESMPASTNPNPRVASEEAARAVADRGVRVSVVRLAPSVHGDGDHGFVPILINMAREKGASAYLGEGLNDGPQCIGLMLPICSDLLWKRGPQELTTTVLLKKACHSGKSSKSSATASKCRSSA